MQAFQYTKSSGLFDIDVLGWDGKTQPTDPNKAITSAETCGVPLGDEGGVPVPGSYLHKFTATDNTDPRIGTWGEGDSDAAAKKQTALDDANKAAINAEAQGRIINSLPSGEPDNFIFKEINMLARMLELRDIKDGRALTTEEQAEYDGMKAVWTGVKNIRATAKAAKTNNTPVDQIAW